MASDITDEMIEAGARSLADTIDPSMRVPNYLRGYARDVLEAALAGRAVVELPEPTGKWSDGVPHWDAEGRTIAAQVDDAGRPYTRLNGQVWLVTEAEAVGMALVAAAREARRLVGSIGSEPPAAGSSQPDNADCPLTPFCDRKPDHPGICMTRCSKTVGCTERVGHRGRCTEGTFNQIAWRVGSETPAGDLNG